MPMTMHRPAPTRPVTRTVHPHPDGVLDDDTRPVVAVAA